MKEVLVLTSDDERNYRALCAAVFDRPMRKSKSRRPDDTLTPAQKLRKLHDQDFACYDCGTEFQSHNGRFPEATTEHIIPYRYGSSANAHNTILVCKPCNWERNEKFSIAIIEEHFGKIDMSMIDDTPHLDMTNDPKRPYAKD